VWLHDTIAEFCRSGILDNQRGPVYRKFGLLQAYGNISKRQVSK
jgi:hypothetical protein